MSRLANVIVSGDVPAGKPAALRPRLEKVLFEIAGGVAFSITRLKEAGYLLKSYHLLPSVLRRGSQSRRTPAQGKKRIRPSLQI